MHVIVMAKGQRKYLEEWETFLLTRSYKAQLPNDPHISSQPNIRQIRLYDMDLTVKKEENGRVINVTPEEIRLYDMSFFCSVWSQFLYDLAPFNELQSRAPKSFLWLAKIIRKIFRLKEPPKPISKRKVINPTWRDFVNVEILATSDDKWQFSEEIIPADKAYKTQKGTEMV